MKPFYFAAALSLAALPSWGDEMPPLVRGDGLICIGKNANAACPR